MRLSHLHSGRRAAPVPLRRVAASLAIFLALVVLTGCPSGYVQTSTGATVAASTVYAQDLVGDALQAVQEVHNGAVLAHDAKAGQEPADVHAARRAKLLASAAGLRSGWDGLAAWKAGTEGGSMVAVVSKVRDALPGLLTVAVELRLVSQDYADAIGVFFGTAAQGRTPAPLKKVPVVSVLVPAWEHGEVLDVFRVTRNSVVVQPDGYFDGCNWHTPLPNGGWGTTAMICGHSKVQLADGPAGTAETATLEVRR